LATNGGFVTITQSVNGFDILCSKIFKKVEFFINKKQEKTRNK
jgi:hypothetical protein